jgi:phosphohistidine phosphatase SixA
MRLYFLRHAHALPGADDAARPLSPRGWRQARGMARFLEEAGIEFDLACSSPLVRACETAEAVLHCCGAVPAKRLRKVNTLLNDATQNQFDAWLRALPDANHVLLVGHAPTLADRVRALLGITDPDTLVLPKGALACLETEDRRTATLKLFLAPRFLDL